MLTTSFPTCFTTGRVFPSTAFGHIQDVKSGFVEERCYDFIIDIFVHSLVKCTSVLILFCLHLDASFLFCSLVLLFFAYPFIRLGYTRWFSILSRWFSGLFLSQWTNSLPPCTVLLDSDSIIGFFHTVYL